MNAHRLTALCRLVVAATALLSAQNTACMAQKTAEAAQKNDCTAREVSPVVGFPSAEPGYALGVSACYAGRIGQ